jgi:hypothetical protein
MEYKNWILKEYSEFITPVFNEFMPSYADFLISKGVYANKDLSKVETFINWKEYSDCYSFFYYYTGCEEDICNRLKKTSIVKHANLIMDFGKGEPVCKIPINIFIDNWLDFVIGAQYLTTVITEDTSLIMEFVKGDFLNSNFKI